MKLMYRMIASMVCASVSTAAYTMTWGNLPEKKNNAPLKVYAVPGLDNGGSSEPYVRSLFKNHDVAITRIETPSEHSDLGQDACITHLRNELAKDQCADTSHHAVVHATSQGTAAVLNHIAEHGKDERVKCFILEGPLVSGNRAIAHKLRGNHGGYGPIMRLPFSDYWVPYLAKLLRFPQYNPDGKHVIKSIPHVPNDTPIIIAHSKHDPTVSHDDACALYHGLKEHGNNDVYFISKEGSKHTHLLDESDRSVIRAILKKHEILPRSESQPTIDLTPYQPDHTTFADLYHRIRAQEEMHGLIKPCVYTAMAVAAGYVTVKSVWYLHKKLQNRK